VALESLAGVEKASFTNNVFPGINNTTVFRSVSSNIDHVLGAYYADYDQLEVLRLQLAQGRWFSRDFPSDSVAAVVNEAAAREMGWENPLEEKLTNFNGESSFNMNIVGVIKDFNFENMKTNVRPMVIMLTAQSNNLLVRYQGQARDIIPKMEEMWKENATGEPFEYTFLDENYDNLFREEQRLSTLVAVFTGLAILIACLGLFALASFTAEQRTKEIGIRKAMGASVGGLTLLLSREFTWLVLISIVLAVVPAYYVMNQWLSGFAYRIDMGMGIFLISSVSALVIAWLTVSFQSLKAAQAKPVNSLRYE
jgi:putative ABC transport system permease protein